MHLVILDRLSPQEREAVHALVTEYSDGWWHWFRDAWFVDGKTAAEWRDLIGKAIVAGPAAVLVLTLPEGQEDRYWAYYGPEADERMKWLHEEYAE